MMEQTSKYTMYDAKSNTLYINSDSISPGMLGMSWKEWKKEWDRCFKMPYPERIEEYASPVAKRYIKAEIEAHPGCKLSEYTIPNCGI